MFVSFSCSFLHYRIATIFSVNFRIRFFVVVVVFFSLALFTNRKKLIAIIIFTTNCILADQKNATNKIVLQIRYQCLISTAISLNHTHFIFLSLFLSTIENLHFRMQAHCSICVCCFSSFILLHFCTWNWYECAYE